MIIYFNTPTKRMTIYSINNMDFNITSDGRYFKLGDRVYDSITGLNSDIENSNPIFICEMFKNLFKIDKLS
jgi:hypothetical protein